MAVFAPPEGTALDACMSGRQRTVRVDGADLTWRRSMTAWPCQRGWRLRAPRILEQPDTTIFIDPGLTGRVDRFGNVVILTQGRLRWGPLSMAAQHRADAGRSAKRFPASRTAPMAGRARRSGGDCRLARAGSRRWRTPCGQAGGWIVSTHFTLVPGKGGRALHRSIICAKLRPVSRKGRFRARRLGPCAWWTRVAARGSVGGEGRLFGVLPVAPVRVRACAGLAIDTLIFAGIVTQGGVASTLRDAHVRDLHTVLLSDGCASVQGPRSTTPPSADMGSDFAARS